MELETVDVIIPNYNKQAYIADCLDSLTNQTYTNWRCIVVDGFSEDGSWEIIQDFAQNDARFKLYQIPRTGNLYSAWNFGLSKVTNPYFCILTSDDVWTSRWLETGIKSLAENQNAIAVAAKTKEIDANGMRKERTLLNPMGDRFFQADGSTPQLRNGIVDSIANYFLGPIYSSIHSLLMRSEVLQRGEKFSEDLGSTADYKWYIRLGLHGDIIYHPSIELGWRKYEEQATKPKNQQENGKFIHTIHLQTRDEIAKKLGSLANEFRAIAQDYDRKILAYHYARPYIDNIKDKPLTEITRLFEVLRTMPQELFKDCWLKTRGKVFFVEESIAMATKFYEKMRSEEKIWKEKYILT